MDPKEVFERRKRRGVGPMAPGPKAPGPLESVEEAIFDRLPLPISDGLPRALEFRRRTESWFSFPYHCLMNVEYHPHDRLTLTFSTHVVAVSGRNLERVYDAIREQSCEVLEEMDRAKRLAAGDKDWEVHAIAVEAIGKSGARSTKPGPGPGKSRG